MIIFIFMPMKILATDYFEHDRSKNYVALGLWVQFSLIHVNQMESFLQMVIMTPSHYGTYKKLKIFEQMLKLLI